MSIYGNNIFRELDLESVEELPLEENTEEIQESLVIPLTINTALFVGTVAFKVVKNLKIQNAKIKLNAIEEYYKQKDSKFITRKELVKEVYSCKRFFDQNIKKEKKLSGLLRVFNGVYPDTAHVFFKDNKEVFTYFLCKDYTANSSVGLDKTDNNDIKLNLSGNFSSNKQMFFKMNDNTLNKYKYYYLSIACLKSKQMTKEACNWIEEEYNKIARKEDK